MKTELVGQDNGLAVFFQRLRRRAVAGCNGMVK